MGARDLLAELADAGLSVRAEGERLVTRPASKLTVAMRSALIDAKPELLALLTNSRPYKLTRTQGNAAHAEAWNDAACARFVARVVHLMRQGIDATDADDLAERLHLRDVEADDRRLCLECSWLGDSGRCIAAATGRLPGTDRRLQPMQTVLQRCPAFGLRKGLP